MYGPSGSESPYSSVVEHPLSKRKVGSSILPGGKYHAFVSREDMQCHIRELSVLLSGRLSLFALMSTRVYLYSSVFDPHLLSYVSVYVYIRVHSFLIMTSSCGHDLCVCVRQSRLY